MQDLQEVTQDVHYENYRSERLAKGVAANRKTSAPGSTTPAAQEQNGDKERILQVCSITHCQGRPEGGRLSRRPML